MRIAPQPAPPTKPPADAPILRRGFPQSVRPADETTITYRASPEIKP
jgi:hypothetical protein